MPLTIAGRNFIAAAIINDGPPTFFNNDNAAIGIGDDDEEVAESSAHTDLQGAQKLRKGMTAEYPKIQSNNQLLFQSEFGANDANWEWEEWGVFNDDTAASGTMLNRKRETLGVKAQGSTWVITVTVTVNLG